MSFEGEKFSFLASLLQLLARTIPEFVDELKLVGPDDGSDESQKSELLGEFQRILTLTQSGESEIRIDRLGGLLLETIPSLQQHPEKVWNTVKRLVRELDGKALEYMSVAGTSCLTCNVCGTSRKKTDFYSEIPISVTAYTGKKDLQDLLNDVVSKSEALEHFGCAFDGCVVKEERDKARVILEPLSKKRKAGKLTEADEKQRLRVCEPLRKFTGVRKVTFTTFPPVLVLILERWRRNAQGESCKSAKHVQLNVEESLDFNGAKYALMGIQRHKGTTVDSGDWTTVVRDECRSKSTWTEYNRTKISIVKACKVSSGGAVVLICHKLEEGNLFAPE